MKQYCIFEGPVFLSASSRSECQTTLTSTVQCRSCRHDVKLPSPPSEQDPISSELHHIISWPIPRTSIPSSSDRPCSAASRPSPSRRLRSGPPAVCSIPSVLCRPSRRRLARRASPSPAGSSPSSSCGGAVGAACSCWFCVPSRAKRRTSIVEVYRSR